MPLQSRISVRLQCSCMSWLTQISLQEDMSGLGINLRRTVTNKTLGRANFRRPFFTGGGRGGQPRDNRQWCSCTIFKGSQPPPPPPPAVQSRPEPSKPHPGIRNFFVPWLSQLLGLRGRQYFVDLIS